MSPAAKESTAQAQAGKSSEAKVETERDLPNSGVPEPAHDETTEVEVLTNESTTAAEVPSEVPDDEPIGICEYEVMKATYEPCSGGSNDTSENQGATKPRGSATVPALLRIVNTDLEGNADICVDTGADITVCTTAYLTKVFGSNSLPWVSGLTRLPRLLSASGHPLDILGKIHLELVLGTFVIRLKVIVQKCLNPSFLLGSDAFYGRMIFDRGKYLAFAGGLHRPVPIKYKLERTFVSAAAQTSIAPRSSALIPVKVTNCSQFVGQPVVFSCSNDWSSEVESWKPWAVHSTSRSPVCDTVSVINSDGEAMVMVQNVTEDYLIFPEGVEVAKVNLLTEVDQLDFELQEKETEYFSINQVPVIEPLGENSRNDDWVKQALNPEFISKKLPNLHLRGESLDDANAYQVNFVHSKEERKMLLDGTGDDFPTPPSAEPFEPELEADPDAWLNNIEHSHLDDQEWEKLKAVLIYHDEAFSRSKTDIGCCRYFKAELPLKPGTGYLYSKPRPLPHKHREVARKTIDDLLEQGIIRPSKSPHATNIVVVNKKALNGVVQHRVCVDLRQINEHSIPNRFPNFQLEEAMAKVQGAVLRSSFDFCNAFHQIMLTEDSIPVTAFYFDNVLYEYVRVPFGHVCAMNLFCNVMALLCEGYKEAGYYADDLMVTTKNDPKLTKSEIFDMHLTHIAGMLKRIIDAGLKLKAHKCQWCYGADKPMEWLGFTMQNNLLRPQESKVEKVKTFPTPVSPRQCLAFLGLTGFYRRFIKSYARIALPIYAAAHGEVFHWSEFAEQAFGLLKEVMCSSPVLKLPRQELPYIMYSDASHRALGVVLCQVDPDDQKEHPCAYGSRKFNDSELKFSTPMKELLAIIYGLCLWYHYIIGNPIRVYSDCRAWTFLKVQTGISGKISRLALLVQEYDLTVSFVQGAKNKAADGLSRAWDEDAEPCDNQAALRHPALEGLQAPPLEEGQSMRLTEYLDLCEPYVTKEWPKILSEYERRQEEYREEAAHADEQIRINRILFIDRETVQEAQADESVVTNDMIIMRTANVVPYEQSDIGDSSDHIVIGDEDVTTDGEMKVILYSIRMIAFNDSYFTVQAFAEAQAEDDFCYKIMQQLQNKNPVTKAKGYFGKKVGKHAILMRRFLSNDNESYTVVCVPQSLVSYLLTSSHGNLLHGHIGKQRYILNMRKKYYWKGMGADIERFHDKCVPCQLNDKYPVRYTLGSVIRPLKPMHIVYYDIVQGLPKSVDGNYAILLFYDGFSRFTFGIPLASENAGYIVKKVMSHFVAAFGLPWALHSDNGLNVDGSMIRHLARLLGVIKTSTPPYTPRSNPCETACGAVSMLIRKVLFAKDQRYWSECLPFVLNALNSTIHTVTGYAPNSLFLGRNRTRELVPVIPLEDSSANVDQYYRQLRRFQELAFQIAKARSDRQKDLTRERANDKARRPKFAIGDFVLVKDNSPGKGPGQRKLRAKYVGPYRVVTVYPASLVVIPWSEGKSYELYRRQPDLFRLRHRADIRMFHTIQVSVAQCKPYKGLVDHRVLWNEETLKEFLQLLEADCDDDLQSIMVPSESGSTATSMSDFLSSSDDDDSRGPRPPRWGDDVTGTLSDSDSDSDYQGPQNQQADDWSLGRSAHSGGSSVDSMMSNLDADAADLDLLQQHIIPDDQLSNASDDAINLHDRINDLLFEVQHPDQWIRNQAQQNLRELVQDLRQMQHDAAAGNQGNLPNAVNDQPAQRPVDQDQFDGLDDQPAQRPVDRDRAVDDDRLARRQVIHDPFVEDLGDDGDDEPLPRPKSLIHISSSDSSHSIDTEHFKIVFKPKTPGSTKVFRRKGSDGRTLTGVPDDQPDPRMVHDWVEDASPTQGLSNQSSPESSTPPTVTRSGRASKPPTRYSPTQIDQRQREARDLMRSQKATSLPKSRGRQSVYDRPGTSGITKTAKTLFIDPEANAEGRQSESVKSEIKSEGKDPLLVEDDQAAFKEKSPVNFEFEDFD